MLLFSLMKRGLIVGVLLLASVCSVVGFFLYQSFTTPGPSLKHPVIIFVPKGMTLQIIAQRLASEGLIPNARLFAWWARFIGADRQLKSGEYLFTTPLSPLALLRMLTSGEGLHHAVTATEGMTFRQISALLAAQGLGAEENFLCLNDDPTFLAAWGLPPQGMEGYLYPDTYRFSWLTSPEEILGRMVERFYATINSAMYRQAVALDLSMHQVITLASIIEKETGAPAERPLIAAVFYNRLRKGMPLQSDPTVIYGINHFDGNLTRQHLLTPTPYNTYLFHGLPPGPIASPGLESLLAALYPAERDYLYFVAKGDGTHVFSSDLNTHNRAVQRFQRGHS
ncbi:MAG TPA: endolytic transglycosylase MltG [Candidatus Binatia bacterium]|nr:endolytic transglycosylase MltG [Candidatus Binatia bacterium]